MGGPNGNEARGIERGAWSKEPLAETGRGKVGIVILRVGMALLKVGVATLGVGVAKEGTIEMAAGAPMK